MKTQRVLACVLALFVTLTLGVYAGGNQEASASEGEEKVELLWWMHWADEPGRRALFETIREDYMAQNPNVEIELVWWDKKELFPALRNTLTTGSEFPDLFYFEDFILEFIDAGWVADLSDAIDWSNVRQDGKEYWTKARADGTTGVWAIPLERDLAPLIYYNPALFEKIGIDVPEDKQFSEEEFLQVCRRIRAAGYDPFAQGIGDRPYPGIYIVRAILLAQLGEEKFRDLWYGEASWRDPDVRKALDYVKKLIDVPVNPPTYSTMGLAESHVYFHTQQRAAMFLVGAWYTARAFAEPEAGGQPDDFRVSFLKYPEMKNGKGAGKMITAYAGSMALAADSRNLEEAKKLADFVCQEKYGNMWLAKTAIPTGIKTNPDTIQETDFEWYFKEMEESLSDVEFAKVNLVPSSGDLWDAYVSIFNEGLPMGMISLDEAVERLEKARQK